jgi:hypothetical protein
LALGNVGADAQSAVPALQMMTTNDPDPLVRKAAKEAMERLKS